MALRLGAPRSLEEAGLEVLREAFATETRRVRRNDRRLEAEVVSDELAGVLRGAALDPRQEGVLREEDIRSPTPPREPPPPKAPRIRPPTATEPQEHERVAAVRQKNALATMKLMFQDMEGNTSKRVLDPDSRLARNLRRAVFGCCLFTVFAEPYLLAVEQFAADKRGNVPGLLVGLSVASEIFCLLDMIAGPLKGYFWLAPGGAGWKKEMLLAHTAYNYVRTSFAVDFFSRICPVQLVIFATDHSFESIDVLFVLSIMKLLSIRRVWDVLTSFVDSDIRWYRSVGLAKAGLLWLIAMHWLACLWLIVLARSTAGHESASEAAAGIFMDSCSDRTALVVNNTVTGQYICAYYRVAQTLTTTTYGDMPATGFADRALTIGCMYLGAALVYLSFLHFFGSANASEELQFIHQRNAIVEFLRHRSLAVEILDDTKSFYQHRWNSSRGFIDLIQLQKLPACMRVQAFHHLYSEIIEHISFLYIRPPEDIFFWNFMIERMHHETYMPGDVIRRPDDPEHYDAIFVMLSGSVEEVHQETGYVYRRHRGPSWFGEVEKITGCKRAAAIHAVDICDVLELDLALIQSILSMPTMRDVRKVLEDCCRDRKYRPGIARWKYYWGKHKKSLLGMAASIAQPPSPWPSALQPECDLKPTSAAETLSEGGSCHFWQAEAESGPNAHGVQSTYSQVQDGLAAARSTRSSRRDQDDSWTSNLPNMPVSDSADGHVGMHVARKRRPPQLDEVSDLAEHVGGGGAVLGSAVPLQGGPSRGALEMGWR